MEVGPLMLFCAHSNAHSWGHVCSRVPTQFLTTGNKFLILVIMFSFLVLIFKLDFIFVTASISYKINVINSFLKKNILSKISFSVLCMVIFEVKSLLNISKKNFSSSHVLLSCVCCQNYLYCFIYFDTVQFCPYISVSNKYNIE